METRIIVAYCICDDTLKKFKVKELKHTKMSLAEVMTTALVATMFFRGNQALSCEFMLSSNRVKHMLNKGHFNRKLHSIPKCIWMEVFNSIAKKFKQSSHKKEFLVDSCPISICHNVRARVNKTYREKQYFGYIASKKEYFYGVKIHLLTTAKGQPIEFLIKPGSMHDSKAFKQMNINLPRASVIYADSAYINRKTEYKLLGEKKILLLAQKRSNAKHQMSKNVEIVRKRKRKKIETTFSLLQKLLPKSIHAISKKGFELKIINFIITIAIFALT